MGNLCSRRASADSLPLLATREIAIPTSRDLAPSALEVANAQGAGRAHLVSYLAQTQKKLEGCSPDAEELKVKILPSIAKNLNSLTKGAPAAVRESFHQALQKHKVLPDYEANKEDMIEVLKECAQTLKGAGGGPPAKVTPPKTSTPEPTGAELEKLSAVVSRLWEIDAPYRLEPDRDFKLSHQARAQSHSSFHSAPRDLDAGDAAAEPLFEGVNMKKLLSNPCSKSFLNLLNNYQADTGKAEVVTSEEKTEMDVFISELMSTPHMRYIHKVLVAWKVVDADPHHFASQVFDIWFTQFRTHHGGPLSSSGFEHVFVGEQNKEKDEVSGLHNWIQFWREEKAGRVNYKGYVGALTAEDKQLVKIRFAWGDEDKNVSTILVGSSIPFEFAVMTATFLGFGGEAKVGGIQFGPNIGPVQLTAYPWKTSLGQVIRSVFIEG